MRRQATVWEKYLQNVSDWGVKSGSIKRFYNLLTRLGRTWQKGGVLLTSNGLEKPSRVTDMSHITLVTITKRLAWDKMSQLFSVKLPSMIVCLSSLINFEEKESPAGGRGWSQRRGVSGKSPYCSRCRCPWEQVQVTCWLLVSAGQECYRVLSDV